MTAVDSVIACLRRCFSLWAVSPGKHLDEKDQQYDTEDNDTNHETFGAGWKQRHGSRDTGA